MSEPEGVFAGLALFVQVPGGGSDVCRWRGGEPGNHRLVDRDVDADVDSVDIGVREFLVEVVGSVPQRRGGVDVADLRDGVDGAGSGGEQQSARTGLAHVREDCLGGGDGAVELELDLG